MLLYLVNSLIFFMFSVVFESSIKQAVAVAPLINNLIKYRFVTFRLNYISKFLNLNSITFSTEVMNNFMHLDIHIVV